MPEKKVNSNESISKKGLKPMAKRRAEQGTGHQIRGTGSEAVDEAHIKQVGSKFEWHFGRVTRLGNFEPAGGRGVTIVWEEGGVSSQQGNLTIEQWEIFKLAFNTSGRIAVLSDHSGESWMHDYRCLEAIR
jgi:hypothetical protein